MKSPDEELLEIVDRLFQGVPKNRNQPYMKDLVRAQDLVRAWTGSEHYANLEQARTTPADVAGMTNEEAINWLEGHLVSSRAIADAESANRDVRAHARLRYDVYTLAIAALRSAPPAPGNGAAEMREACAKAVCPYCRNGSAPLNMGTGCHATAKASWPCDAIDIWRLPLPAPEVAEVRPSKCPKCGNSRAQASHGVCPHPDCPMEGYQT